MSAFLRIALPGVAERQVAPVPYQASIEPLSS